MRWVAAGEMVAPEIRRSHVSVDPVDTTNYISIQKGVQLQPNLQHTGNLIGHGMTARLPVLSPSSILLTALSFSKEKKVRFEILLLHVFYFF